MPYILMNDCLHYETKGISRLSRGAFSLRRLMYCRAASVSGLWARSSQERSFRFPISGGRAVSWLWSRRSVWRLFRFPRGA